MFLDIKNLKVKSSEIIQDLRVLNKNIDGKVNFPINIFIDLKTTS